MTDTVVEFPKPKKCGWIVIEEYDDDSWTLDSSHEDEGDSADLLLKVWHYMTGGDEGDESA